MTRTPDQQSAIDVVNGWARRLVMDPPLRQKGRRQASHELLDVVTFLEAAWPLSPIETTSSDSNALTLTWPIEGREPSRDQVSLGGWSNDHLARGEGEALDIAVLEGTPLCWPHDGTLTQAGWLGDAGIALTVEWDAEDGHYLVRLCHLKTNAWGPGVREGIKAGDFAGYSGNTGLSTGPHLHIFLERNGVRLRLEDVWGLAS